jgi:hypothetical protein
VLKMTAVAGGILVADPAAESGAWAVLTSPAVVAALVAAVVSTLGWAVAHRKEDQERVRQFRVKQVNEFYAPVRLLLAENASLAKQLREAARAGDREWHLLDNLAQVASDPELLLLAERIIKVNREIREILMTKAGLALQAPLPSSYERWIAHAHLLEQSVQSRSVPANVEAKYFPKEFEEDIRSALQAAVSRLKESYK